MQCAATRPESRTVPIRRWIKLQTSGKSPSPRSSHEVVVIGNKVSQRNRDVMEEAHTLFYNQIRQNHVLGSKQYSEVGKYESTIGNTLLLYGVGFSLDGSC